MIGIKIKKVFEEAFLAIQKNKLNFYIQILYLYLNIINRFFHCEKALEGKKIINIFNTNIRLQYCAAYAILSCLDNQEEQDKNSYNYNVMLYCFWTLE